jgi:thiol-disulfide isomerase/thioredoxin
MYKLRQVLLATLYIGLAFLFSSSIATAAEAPSVTLNTPSGKINLESLRGKVIYLDFWASWCVPCRKSFPWMNDMHKRYGDKGLVVLAVNLDKDKASVTRFLEKYPADFIIAYDPEGHSAEKYNVKAMPSSWIIDQNGNVVKSHRGFREKDKAILEQEIRHVLSSNRASK